MLKRLSLDKGKKRKRKKEKGSCKREFIEQKIFLFCRQHLKEIVLPNYPLVLFLLKYRNVWVFWNKKKSDSNSLQKRGAK